MRNELVEQLELAGAISTGRNRYKCFIHDDSHQSAWIKKSNKGIWYYNCAVCGVRYLKDLKEINKMKYYNSLDEIIANLAVEEINNYKDLDGNVKFVSVRYKHDGAKSFFVAHNTKNGWIKKKPDEELILFNLKTISESDRVVFVEGEKCVRYLHSIGIPATTTLGGSNSAIFTDVSPLAGKEVIIWRDADAPGLKYQQSLIEMLENLNPAPVIKVLNVEEFPVGFDVADVPSLVKKENGNEQDILNYISLVLDDAEEINKLKGFENFLEELGSGDYKNLPINDCPILSEQSQCAINGTITIVYGAPGLGKSLLTNKACDDWHRQGYNVVRLNLEDELERHILRSFAQTAGDANLDKTAFHRNPENKEYIKRKYEENKIFLNSLSKTIVAGENKSWDVEKLLAWVESQLIKGKEVVVIDPISVVMSDRVWVDAHNLIWGLKKLLAKYKNARIILVTHPNDTGDIGGGKAYRRFAQCVLNIKKYSEPKEVQILNKDETFDETISTTIEIIKCRWGGGLGLEIAVAINRETLILEELGIVTKMIKK
jgi:5S rRNA maturation endonuclease (ribonuclease M5)/KaiC/GvpD/RAD55 family RecA-like ATPase